jgi:hypothetical protein
MNVTEINEGSIPSLHQYFAAAIPLTVATVWIVVALQIQIKDSPSPRRCPKAPTPTEKQGDSNLYMNDNGVGAPLGHELRPAWSAPDGEEIIVRHHDSQTSKAEYDSSYSDQKKGENVHSAFGYDYQPGGYGERQRATIWKRLLWPIILIQIAIDDWQANRTIKQQRKYAGKGHDQDETKGHLSASLSLPFFNKRQKSSEMSPAARLAADVRSQRSGSSKSITEQITRQPTHPSLSNVPVPPSILKKEQPEEEPIELVGHATPESQASHSESRPRDESAATSTLSPAL